MFYVCDFILGKVTGEDMQGVWYWDIDFVKYDWLVHGDDPFIVVTLSNEKPTNKLIASWTVPKHRACGI